MTIDDMIARLTEARNMIGGNKFVYCYTDFNSRFIPIQDGSTVSDSITIDRNAITFELVGMSHQQLTKEVDEQGKQRGEVKNTNFISA